MLYLFTPIASIPSPLSDLYSWQSGCPSDGPVWHSSFNLAWCTGFLSWLWETVLHSLSTGFCFRLPGFESTHWKDSDAGRDWGQEEKGTTEDEMTRWHYWLDGRESQWTPGVGDRQGGLACCNSWGRKESDTTERLIWSDLIWMTVKPWASQLLPLLSVFAS